MKNVLRKGFAIIISWMDCNSFLGQRNRKRFRGMPSDYWRDDLWIKDVRGRW